MDIPLNKKHGDSFIVVCDSVVPALIAYSLLPHFDDSNFCFLVIIEYPDRDDSDESFFEVIEFIFSEFIYRSNVKIIRYYTNDHIMHPIAKFIPWLANFSASSFDQIQLLISSSSKSLSSWEGIFKTTILLHSVISVSKLSRVLFRLSTLKALVKSSFHKLGIYIFLLKCFKGKALGFIKASLERQLQPISIAVPFYMRSIQFSFPVSYLKGIRNINWEEYSPEIACVQPIFSDEKIQAIVILLTGDEPYKKRNNTYNLNKYLSCYQQIFKGLMPITNPAKSISVIFKSHKRYSPLSVAERSILTDSARMIGAFQCVFLEGKNSELPVECLPVRSWDIIVAEDSFALMTMSTQAQCFFADSFFSWMRSKEEQDRTKIQKEFVQIENLDLKDLLVMP